ncbi:hypothetical protein [Burkholderia gladioli]|uniref:hypothetical protein n=1 Tax=Burkholderia gladioli TaxID=28095 RepID=UPI001640BA9B|nr:hypothetical protein [Burkholderia gladioli]
MKIEDYYKKLDDNSRNIYDQTLRSPEVLAKGHNVALDLHKLCVCAGVAVEDEGAMFDVVCSQIETSCLALSYGLYRSAFASLRLSLEFGLGAIYFSANKFAYKEWRSGVVEADIRWFQVNGPDSGVLSGRFSAAFFPEIKELVSDYRERANSMYRKLSEYVHGNHSTWQATGLRLAYNDGLREYFFSGLSEVGEILYFAMCCRYLKEMSVDKIEEVEPILGSMFTHIEPIRVLLGGPRDAK